MPTMLRIDASVRRAHSHSRAAADELQRLWQGRHPAGRVIVRDLAESPVPHVTEAAVAAYFTPDAERTPETRALLALSDKLVDELLSADQLLISTPMYNFSTPSGLKAYIDHIVRVNRTFAYGVDGVPQGLVKGKSAYVVTASGSVFSEGAMQPLDHLVPYLKTVLGFIGVSDCKFFRIEATASDPRVCEATLARTRDAMEQVVGV